MTYTCTVKPPVSRHRLGLHSNGLLGEVLVDANVGTFGWDDNFKYMYLMELQL